MDVVPYKIEIIVISFYYPSHCKFIHIGRVMMFASFHTPNHCFSTWQIYRWSL